MALRRISAVLKIIDHQSDKIGNEDAGDITGHIDAHIPYAAITARDKVLDGFVYDAGSWPEYPLWPAFMIEPAGGIHKQGKYKVF